MLRGRHFAVKNLATAMLVALGLFSAFSARGDSAWGTDLKKAQEEAKANHKLLLLDFTGSDWCGYCVMFDRAILSKPEFKDYANKNLVLVELDYPRRGGSRWNAQSIELKKQNAELAEKFNIEGFPTLVILNGEGKAVWRYDGFYSGGVAAFLAELDKVRKG
jgi:thioredoxin-related protein